MPVIPNLPRWEGMHPLIVHFPIALLAIVPIFVVLGMLRKSWSLPMGWSAWVLLALGCAATILAIESGEATEQFAKGLPAADDLVHRHEDAAESTRNIFLILAAIWTVFLVQSTIKRASFKRTFWVIGSVVFVFAYSMGLLWLMQTGHMGAELVHGLGVRAPVPLSPKTEQHLMDSPAPEIHDDDHH